MNPRLKVGLLSAFSQLKGTIFPRCAGSIKSQCLPGLTSFLWREIAHPQPLGQEGCYYKYGHSTDWVIPEPKWSISYTDQNFAEPRFMDFSLKKEKKSYDTQGQLYY